VTLLKIIGSLHILAFSTKTCFSIKVYMTLKKIISIVHSYIKYCL